MSDLEKMKMIELCKTYNAFFIEKLQRNFFIDYVEGCNAGEEIIYFEMFLDNVFEIDSDLNMIDTLDKFFLIELIKKLPLRNSYKSLFDVPG